MQFTQDQQDLAAMCAEVFADFGTPDLSVIDAATPGDSLLRSEWSLLARHGVLGAMAPEDRGGTGLTDIDVVLVLEELGMAGVAPPVMETMSVIVPLLRDHQDRAEHRELLAQIVSGEVLATIVTSPDGLSPWAADADALMAASPTGLHLLGPGQWEATRVDGVDPSRRLAAVKMDLDPSTLLAGTPAVDVMHARLAVGAAAVLNGVSRRLLDDSVEYAKTRVQFGQPIGSFQAVKHLLADACIAVETSRAASWHAGESWSEGRRDATLSAWVAKSSANLAADTASDHALQVHGGIGFTWEHGLHVWMKRALSLSHAYGTTESCHTRLGSEILQTLDIVAELSGDTR